MSINFNEPATKLKVQQALVFLGLFSNFIRRNNLERLRDLDTRFATDECKSVIQQSWSDVQAALKAMNTGYANLSAGDNAIAADKIIIAVASIAKHTDVPLPSRDDIAYSVKLSEDFWQKLVKALPVQVNRDVRAMLSAMDEQFNTQTAELRELLSEFELFSALMDTLTVPTEFSDYEQFLAEKMTVAGWFTNGQPKDLLVRDLGELRADTSKSLAVYSRPDFCLTQTVQAGNKPDKDFSVLVQKV